MDEEDSRAGCVQEEWLVEAIRSLPSSSLLRSSLCVEYNTKLYNTKLYNTKLYNTKLYNTMQNYTLK